MQQIVYRCTSCGTQAPATQENARLACSENEAGRTLVRLSDAGVPLLNFPLARSLPNRAGRGR